MYINKALYDALLAAGVSPELAEKAAEAVVPVDVLKEQVESLKKQITFERWSQRVYFAIIFGLVAAGARGIFLLMDKLP